MLRLSMLLGVDVVEMGFRDHPSLHAFVISILTPLQVPHQLLLLLLLLINNLGGKTIIEE